MKKLALVLLSFTMLGCNEIDGVTEAFTDFVLAGKKSEVLVPEGRHETELKFRSKEKIEMKLNINGEESEVVFRLAREYDFPRRNGTFFIPADDNSQGVDIDGEIRTHVEESRREFRDERCSRTVYRRECRVRRDGRRICRDVPVTRHGWKRVEYHYEETEQELTLNIADGNAELARFHALDRSRRRVMDYEGPCRVY
jgi:hypothetical protein